MRLTYTVIVLLVFTSCEKLLLEEDAQNSPENNFEIFWNDFNRYYSQFSYRKIDWDSVYSVYRPQVSSLTTGQQLFDILSEIVHLINDMHVTLFTPLGNASWQAPYPSGYPSKWFINPSRYLVFGEEQEPPFEYRDIKTRNIGYIIIYSFLTEGKLTNSDNDKYLQIDNILEEFKDKDGIIIDVRWNPGGNSLYGKTVASRFADKKRLTGKSVYKTGPGVNDFSDEQEWYIEPGGDFQYTKPVVVLTSRATSSSAELFVTYMNVLPHVTVVGDTTAGGVGSPIIRELPNGWNFRLSTSIHTTSDNRIIEKNGIAPDITVQTSKIDSIYHTDRIIEKGIEVIENSNY